MTADPPEIIPSAASPEGPATIFVSDASAEADRLSTALRSRGYAVVDVPLSLLVARVAVQRSALILLDIDEEGALDAVDRLREAQGAAAPELLFLGEPNKVLTDPRAVEKRGHANFFARPVDVLALTQRVEALIGSSFSVTQALRAPLPSIPASGPSSEPRSLSSKPPVDRTQVHPPSSRAPLLPERVPGAQASIPVMSTFPESWSDRAPPQSQGPIVHSLESGPWKVPLGLARIPTASLSPEIEALLQGAEARAAQDPVPSSQPPTPDEEVEAVLPADVLAALDEPIDGDEDDGDSGSGSGSPTPGKSTTGSRDRTTGREVVPPVRDRATGETGPGGTPGLTSAPTNRPVQRLDASVPPPPRSAGASADADLHEIETPRPPRRAAQPLPVIPPPAPVPAPPPSEANPPSLVASRPTTAPPSMMRDAPAPSASLTAPPPRSAPPREEPVHLVLPEVLGAGDAVRALALCTSHRVTGACSVESAKGMRRVVFREGDIVTAASGIDDEALVAFLGARGDIPKDVASRLRSKVPAFGRHAGAALIANGHLSQDQLWPILRAHAEWVLGEVMNVDKGTATLEADPPGRLKAEPSVFGGATGAEVLIEAVRRVVPAEMAVARLGGMRTGFRPGQNADLLTECALSEPEQGLVLRSHGAPLSEVLAAAPQPETAPMVYALVLLGVLETIVGGTDAPPARPLVDPLDEEALRTRVRARLGLVQEGDYFALLGVPRSATSYEIRRAYLDLRRAFEPSRALTVKTADLADEMRLIIEVLDEAHEVLRDQTRRERYRRAIEAGPPH